MLRLERKKLLNVLQLRGLSINQLAKLCGISRQSIYNMLKTGTVFNTPFEKIINFLGVDFMELTLYEKTENDALRCAPVKIQKIAMELISFADKHGASLVLFGSRARGRGKITADWDFGIDLHEKFKESSFIVLKHKLMEQAFPYRVDIVNLRRAPDWFIDSISEDIITLAGKWKIMPYRKRRAA